MAESGSPKTSFILQRCVECVRLAADGCRGRKKARGGVAEGCERVTMVLTRALALQQLVRVVHRDVALLQRGGGCLANWDGARCTALHQLAVCLLSRYAASKQIGPRCRRGQGPCMVPPEAPFSYCSTHKGENNKHRRNEATTGVRSGCTCTSHLERCEACS